MTALRREPELLYLAGGGDKQSRDDCAIKNYSTSASQQESFGQHIFKKRSHSLETPHTKSPTKCGAETKRNSPCGHGGDPLTMISNQNQRLKFVQTGNGGHRERRSKDKEELKTLVNGHNDLELENAFDSMNNVNDIYQQKLNWIEKNVPRGSVLSPNLKSKISLYQLWVEDLKEQNQALMDIIRDVKNENSQQSFLLKTKFSKVEKSFLKQDFLVKALEKDIDQLNLVNKKLVEEKKMMKKASTHLNEERLKSAEEEIENLTTLLLRIRDECTWNISGIQLSSEVQEQLFGQHPQLPGSQIGSSHAIIADNVTSQSSFTFNEKCVELESTREELENLRKKFDFETLTKVSDMQQNFNSVEELRINLREANIKLKYYHNMIEELKGKIRVYCRIRPSTDDKIVTKYLDPYTVGVETSKGVKEFQFDRIFGSKDDQKAVFNETKSLIQSAFDGFNVCIAAYGQTGSGKTFTILGENSDPGIAPMAFSELFSITKKMESCYKTVISFYAVELYRQKLIDLLSVEVESTSVWNELPENNSEKLEIRRDHTGTVFIQGARTIVVDDCESFEKYLKYVLGFRHTAETQLNERSSRSHFIMGIIIENTSKFNGSFTRGKLSLVDLAGSERNGKFNGPSNLMEESKAINKSLSALEHVIVALTTDQQHVPYRNNKLTELMQDSIGGNAKTLMFDTERVGNHQDFVNISPTLSNVDETIVSLNYGARLKQVVNSSVRNVDAKNPCETTPRSKPQQNSTSKTFSETPPARSKMGFMSRQ